MVTAIATATATDRRGCARLLVVLETTIHIFAVTPDDAAAALCGTIALNGLILRRGMVATDGHARLIYCLTTAGLELWTLPASGRYRQATRPEDGERQETPLLVHIQGLALASGQLPAAASAGRSRNRHLHHLGRGLGARQLRDFWRRAHQRAELLRVLPLA